MLTHPPLARRAPAVGPGASMDAAWSPEEDPAAWIAEAFALVNPDAAAANALAARALGRVAAESSLAGQARHVLGLTECLLGRIASGCAMLRAATETLERHGPALAACRAWRDYGSVMIHLSGDTHAGLQALHKALVIAETLGDAHEEGVLLSRLGPAMGHAGRVAEARRLLQRAVDLLATDPDRDAYATAVGNLGHFHMQQGDHARALPLLRAEQALRDPVKARLHAVNCESNLSIALAGTGHATEAKALLASLRPRLDPATDVHQWVDYLLASGRVALLLGDAPTACTHLTAGLQSARQHALHLSETELLSALAQAQERCGDLAAALASERALRQAERNWLDEQSAARMRAMEASIELAQKHAENQALEQARAELEQRVQQRTAELNEQMREREAAQDLARFWADHDWLTRLPNRRQLKARLEAMLEQAKADGTQLGVLFVDLDGFKGVNDAHGHLAGDHILRVTARRLVRHAPAGAVVTRFGGDEFVVLLPGQATPGAVMAGAQRLRSAVLASLTIDRRPVRLSCSIGVAVGPRDGPAPEQLLRRADRAMLQAKGAGRNRVCVLDADGQDRLDRRGRLRRELGAAIEDGRLTAAYQPLWDLRQHRLRGVELLARWHDPELGVVSPAEFIPLAEESGLIGALGLWAVRQAVAAARALHRAAGSGATASHARGRPSAEDGAGVHAVRVAVNVSTVQLGDPQLVDELVRTVAEEGGQPQWLQLELTESYQLAEDPEVLQRLRHLREAGFTLAIDDFGAGYSSFSYLSRAYFDRLKIDRGLVSAAMQASDRSAVTGSIILMAQRLGLEVVAEGVETKEQMALLAQQGCEIVQGYHIARPMPLDRLLQWTGPG